MAMTMISAIIICFTSIIATVSAGGVLTCFNGTYFDFGPDLPTLSTKNYCLYCLRLKVEITTDKAASLASLGLPSAGVTFWICPQSTSFGIGVPIVDGVLSMIRNYLDLINNQYTCTDSTVELRPKSGGKITLCSCCANYCNNDTTLCSTAQPLTMQTVISSASSGSSSSLSDTLGSAYSTYWSLGSYSSSGDLTSHIMGGAKQQHLPSILVIVLMGTLGTVVTLLPRI